VQTVQTLCEMQLNFFYLAHPNSHQHQHFSACVFTIQTSPWFIALRTKHSVLRI